MADVGAGFFSFTNVNGWSVTLAIVTVIVAWVASIYAKKGATALVARARGITPEFAALAARLVKYFVVLLGVGVALSFLGAPLQPLLAGAIIVGVVVVIALRGISDNFAAGIVLQTRRPLKVGDEIETDGIAGTVKELNGRSVVIRTRDGRTIHIPNSMLLQQPLINHSEAGARRSEVEVRAVVAPDALDDFTDAVSAALEAVDGIHTRERARILFSRISDEHVALTVQFWHHPTAGPIVLSRVVRTIGDLMRDRSITGTVQSGIPPAPLTPPPAV